METAGTPFQTTVWNALREIPYGETWSYGELAAHIGHPGSFRGVGGANGRNPVSIVVPCHRVIGADGSLTGYGWGIERKNWLLTHERAVSASASLAFVHGLHPGARDGPALLDQVGAQPLRLRHLVGPRITLGDQPRRGVQGEVGRRNAIKVIPGHRE